MTASPWMFHRPDLMRVAFHDMVLLAPGDAEPFDAWMQRAIALLRIRGGQAIVISDWLMPPAEAMRALQGLRRRRVEIKAVQVLSEQELDPARLMRGATVVDSETGATHELAYSPAELARAMQEHNERLARYCKRHSVLFVQHRMDDPLESFLLKDLLSAGFLEPVR